MENVDIYRLDGHTLRVFVAVCETGSISRTAELFDLNQSTVSHTIEKMRNAVGDPLFVKSGRGITPTETAMDLLHRAKRIVAEIESLSVPGKYNPERDKRPFVLGIPTPAMLEDVKVVQAELAREAPRTKFELRRVAPRSEIETQLQYEEIDLAITLKADRLPSVLNESPYGHDTYVVFYDPAVRGPVVSAEDYETARHGVVSYGANGKSIIQASLDRQGIAREIAVVSPTASMLGDLIKGTDIIATMPKRLVQSAYSDLSHCDVPVRLPPIQYQLTWHRRFEHSGRSLWLRELMLRIGRDLYGGGDAGDE